MEELLQCYQYTAWLPFLALGIAFHLLTNVESTPDWVEPILNHRKAGITVAGTLALVYFNHLNRGEIVCVSIISITAILFGLSDWFTNSAIPVRSRWYRGIALFCTFSLLVILYDWHFWPSPPPVGMQCQMELLPISVPAYSEVSLLLLNKSSEFTTYSPGDKPSKWPPEDMATLAVGQPDVAYTCRVASLDRPLEEVMIPLDLLHNNNRHGIFNIHFPLLDRGAVGFHVVTQCPDINTFIIPDDGTASEVGEHCRRSIPVVGDAMPAKIHPFFFMNIHWKEPPPCDP